MRLTHDEVQFCLTQKLKWFYLSVLLNAWYIYRSTKLFELSIKYSKNTDIYWKINLFDTEYWHFQKASGLWLSRSDLGAICLSHVTLAAIIFKSSILQLLETWNRMTCDSKLRPVKMLLRTNKHSQIGVSCSVTRKTFDLQAIALIIKTFYRWLKSKKGKKMHSLYLVVQDSSVLSNQRKSCFFPA